MGGRHRKLVVFPMVILWLGASAVAAMLPNEVIHVLVHSSMVRKAGIAVLKPAGFFKMTSTAWK